MRRRPNRCLHRSHCRGAVMVMTLLAIVLLAALVFYVFNTGHHVQARVVLQNAADASAAAGAGQVARSLNTVAMNNVETARLIAVVNSLDSMPKATAFTLSDQRAMAQAVRSQLQRSVNGSWVRDELQRFLELVEEEIQILEPVDQLLNRSGYDLRRMTYYDSPDGRGDIWQAIESLEAVSLATMENLPLLAQTAAVDGAEVNLSDKSNAATGLMLPILPLIPWQQGEFDDFERPVKQGLLPEDVDDTLTNRGPFDTMFGWHYSIGGETISDGYNAGRGGVPVGLPGGRLGRVTSRTPEFYGVYGPQTWLSNLVSAMARSELSRSRFGWHVSEIAHIKLNYLWPGTELRTVIEPEWQTSFTRATSIAQANLASIRETAFVAVEIKSRYPLGDPLFMSAGSWAYVAYRNRYNGSYSYLTSGARPIWTGGWEDPRTWGAPRVSRYIWRDQWQYQTFYDSEIGIEPTVDEDDIAIMQTVYRIDDFMFVGVNVGEEVEVRNPHNFASRSDLPGPIDFDHDQMEPTDQVKEQYLTFLSVAQRPKHADFWASRFDDDESYDNMVAIAQAHVFNNHSWDLWTQMWHAQLEPVQDYSAWLDTLEGSIADAQNVPAINSESLPQLLEYLKSIEPLAPDMLSH